MRSLAAFSVQHASAVRQIGPGTRAPSGRSCEPKASGVFGGPERDAGADIAGPRLDMTRPINEDAPRDIRRFEIQPLDIEAHLAAGVDGAAGSQHAREFGLVPRLGPLGQSVVKHARGEFGTARGGVDLFQPGNSWLRTVQIIA